MKLAILGDIHSNYAALEACLDEIDRGDFDGIAFLGDFVTDCPYPKRTIEIIRTRTSRYQTWFIKGNREEYLLDYRKEQEEWSYSSRYGSLLYSYEELDTETLDWFEAMPGCMEIMLPECPGITVFHGSPHQLRDMVHPDTPKADGILKSIHTPYGIGAHSHRSYTYHKYGKTLMNCGSVGIPVNGQTDAQFLAIECIGGEWKEQLMSVPYDIEGLLEAFLESGLCEKGKLWTACIMKQLQDGRNYPVECIVLAEKLAAKEGADMKSEEVLEKYWRQAVKELGVI